MTLKTIRSLTFLAMLTTWVVAPQMTQAQATESNEEAVIELDPLIIVASKSPRPLSEVAAQVTLIDADMIRQNLVEDMDGLFRYEPGLEVETSGTRFGATGINIRGVGGNRVAIEQDGIPVRDRFVVGAFSDGGRGLADTDRIKRVEVLHGPASVIYGSNALGGVVAVTTWDPADLVPDDQRASFASLRTGLQGADSSWVVSGIGAIVNQQHGLLLAGTYREGHQLDHSAPAGSADPQDWNHRDALLRYTYDTSAGHQIRLTAAGQQSDTDTVQQSQLGAGRRFRTTTSLIGEDEERHHRFSLDYEFAWSGWDAGVLRLYSTESESDQLTLETRGNARVPVLIERRFYYQQSHSGVDFNLFRQMLAGSVRHRLGWGAEWNQTESEERRDGLQTRLDDGSSSSTILGETFPVRDFPLSRSQTVGLFVQDEIGFAGDRWELIPALRWDRYRLTPRPDDIWREDNPDTAVVTVTESDVTPRLGILWHATDEWNLYGQYARGFRAPPFEDANIGLDIPLFGIRAIPNPDLSSETSDGFEAGVRRFTSHSRFSFAAFYSVYDDFIETRAFVGVDPVTGDLLFQSRNIEKAHIYGIDLRFYQELSAWHERLQGWSLTFAAYWSKGENRESGQPLNSIAPPQAVTGVIWGSADERWRLTLTSTLTASKSRGAIDQTDAARFVTAGWGVIDLTASWQVSDQVSLQAGLFNLGDKTYWRWLDVASFDLGNPAIPLLSRPGRNFSISARFSF